jgi:hypothetical protein
MRRLLFEYCNLSSSTVSSSDSQVGFQFGRSLRQTPHQKLTCKYVLAARLFQVYRQHLKVSHAYRLVVTVADSFFDREAGSYFGCSSIAESYCDLIESRAPFCKQVGIPLGLFPCTIPTFGRVFTPRSSHGSVLIAAPCFHHPFDCMSLPFGCSSPVSSSWTGKPAPPNSDAFLDDLHVRFIHVLTFTAAAQYSASSTWSSR